MHIKKEQKIFIPGPQGKLEAMVLGLSTDDPLPEAIGVVCHPHPLYQGSMDNKVVTTVVRAWQQIGLATLRFNFRGVGGSEGHYDNGIGEAFDLEAVLFYIREKLPFAKIWLAGFSFGAFISLKVAMNIADLAGLISIAPALPFFDFLKLQKPTCPWLLIQGEEDEIVPKEMVKEWYQLLNQEKERHLQWELLLLPEASHFFHGHLIELKVKIEAFTNKILQHKS